MTVAVSGDDLVHGECSEKSCFTTYDKIINCAFMYLDSYNCTFTPDIRGLYASNRGDII